MELEQMREELADSREREKAFREEQLHLLQQIQQIREELARQSPSQTYMLHHSVKSAE